MSIDGASKHVTFFNHGVNDAPVAQPTAATWLSRAHFSASISPYSASRLQATNQSIGPSITIHDGYALDLNVSYSGTVDFEGPICEPVFFEFFRRPR